MKENVIVDPDKDISESIADEVEKAITPTPSPPHTPSDNNHSAFDS